jgi:hypothetical protein
VSSGCESGCVGHTTHPPIHPTHLSSLPPTYLPTYLSTHPPTHPPTYPPIYPPTYPPAYLPFQGCRLELLSIHGLLKAGPRALEALVAHCAPTLRALDVRGCSNVPRRDPAELRAVLPGLTTFTLAK